MRAATSQASLLIQPGRPIRIPVEVTNTTGVIDGIVPVVEGIEPGLDVEYEPPLLPLFPDGTGVITVVLTASVSYPAGPHELVISARSSVHPDERIEVPVRLDVTPVPSAKLAVVPPAQHGRHRVAYSVVCDNTGNTALEVNLAASDNERSVTARFVPSTLVIGPGQSASARLTARARRHFLGGERTKQLAVLGTSAELDLDARATFRQQPVVPRGVRTALILGTIVALWAAVFVVGLNRSLAKDPLTKDAPASFYASAAPSTSTSSKAASGGSLHLSLSDAKGGAPAGAVPKSGVVIGVGGTVDGAVTAASTGQGVGRITVEAIEDTPSGADLISSAATADDGSYSLVGLLPGPYKLLFSAEGYQSVWYPDAPSDTAAKQVDVNAMAITSGIDAVITGTNGSISGHVDTGQTPSPSVTVTVLGNQGSTAAIATVTTDSQGDYTIPNLPAPGTYDLSFSASGYQVASDTVDLAGGQHQIASTIDLFAGTGTLGGTVTDGSNPLGGVTITAADNGQTITSATPTTGAVGQFSIPNLATPGTYLLTFTKTGYGTQTVAEHLGPGQSISNLNVTLAGGAGTVAGLVRSSAGTPLGGVTVSVNGAGKPVTVQTLTAGAIGSYELTGLGTPGNYTLTFSLAGYTSETVGISLGSGGSATGTNVTLPVYSAGVTGTVTSGGVPLTGVSVSLTAGGTPQTTVTSSSPPGGYSFSGLTPGSYSVTFSLTGYQSQTALITVKPGQTATQNISMVKAG